MRASRTREPLCSARSEPEHTNPPGIASTSTSMRATPAARRGARPAPPGEASRPSRRRAPAPGARAPPGRSAPAPARGCRRTRPAGSARPADRAPMRSRRSGAASPAPSPSARPNRRRRAARGARRACRRSAGRLRTPGPSRASRTSRTSRHGTSPFIRSAPRRPARAPPAGGAATRGGCGTRRPRPRGVPAAGLNSAGWRMKACVWAPPIPPWNEMSSSNAHPSSRERS